MAELKRKAAAKAARENTLENIQMLLQARFGNPKEGLHSQLQAIKNRKKLTKRITVAGTCKSLRAFQSALTDDNSAR